MKKLIIFLICNLLAAYLSYGQIQDSICYENYSKYKNSIPQCQILTKLVLLSDSSYIWRSYVGELSDNKINFKNWQYSETKGKWNINKKALVFKQGDMESKYTLNRKSIKYKRIQKSKKGGFTIRYNKWMFEKRAKYKLIKKTWSN